MPVSAGPPSLPSSQAAAAASYPPPPSRRTLNALAKGKAKAADQGSGRRDEESAVEGSNQAPEGLSFAIRFTDGSEDLELWVGQHESVGEVKRRVSEGR